MRSVDFPRGFSHRQPHGASFVEAAVVAVVVAAIATGVLTLALQLAEVRL